MQFDTSYLNRTPNKTARRSEPKIQGIVWHETVSNDDSPYDTLDWNLTPSTPNQEVGSYNYLIARDGRVFHYVDETRFVAWHAGYSSALGHRDFEVSVHTIGVELDGPNKQGVPITPAQWDAAVDLMRYLCAKYRIPMNRARQLTHREIATPPGRKTDPLGCSVGKLVQLAVGAIAPHPGWYRVDDVEANIRPEPNTSRAPVGALERGNLAEYDKVDDGESIGGNKWWLHLKNGRGWVHSSLLTKAAAQPRPGWYRTTTDLNIRPGPSSSGTAVDLLEKGERFRADESVRGEDVNGNDWWLHLQDGRGYASAAYARPIGNAVTVETALLASPRVQIAKAQAYLLSRGHGGYSDDEVRGIAQQYFETARAVGLDPLLLVAQMALETGNLTSDWSQRPRCNFAGIGVTGEPGSGVKFETVEKGIRGHVGRLLAYALPIGSEGEAQRALVEEALRWRQLPDRYRGIAPKLGALAGTWATDPEYAHKISRIANAILATEA